MGNPASLTLTLKEKNEQIKVQNGVRVVDPDMDRFCANVFLGDGVQMKQQLFFTVQDATGRLKPAVDSTDPYYHQRSRINDIKREFYRKHLESEGGKRQIDRVFNILSFIKPENDRPVPMTDREIQHSYQIKFNELIDIGVIPARRVDITNDKDLYKYWRVILIGQRQCTIKGTIKCAWVLENI